MLIGLFCSLNKLPAVAGTHANLSNVFNTSNNRMVDNASDRSSSIGSNTIISWNEDVPDTSNQNDMEMMLNGIATGKFSESPQSAFVNTGAGSTSSHNMHNRSNNSLTRNLNKDVRANTFVRHNNSNNSSTSNISVESKRSTDSKTVSLIISCSLFVINVILEAFFNQTASRFTSTH